GLPRLRRHRHGCLLRHRAARGPGLRGAGGGGRGLRAAGRAPRRGRGGVGRARVLCGGPGGDVAERAFVEHMATRAVTRFGRIDVVVNNAGVSKHKQIYHLTADEGDYVLRVNFPAPALLTLAALPAMLRRGEGWIVNVSSAAGKLPPPRESVY